MLRRVARPLIAKRALLTSTRSAFGRGGKGSRGPVEESKVVRTSKVLEGLPVVSLFGKNSLFGQEVLQQTMSEFEATQAAAAAASASSGTSDASASSAADHKGAIRNKHARPFASSLGVASSGTSAGGSTLRGGTTAPLSLTQRLAQSREKEEQIRRKGEAEARGFVARFLLRRRPIDALGLKVEDEAKELGDAHRAVRSLLNLTTISPVVFAVLTGAVSPSHAVVNIGLVSEETWAHYLGAGPDAVVPPWACLIGQFAFLLAYYDISVFWRYPLMHYVFAPLLRKMLNKEPKQRPASVSATAVASESTDGAVAKPAGSKYSSAAAAFVGGGAGGNSARASSWRSDARDDTAARGARSSPVSDA